MSSKTQPAEPKPLWMITEDYLEAQQGVRQRRADVTEADFLDILKSQLLLHDSCLALKQELQAPKIDHKRVHDLLDDVSRGEEQVHDFMNWALYGDPVKTAPTQSSSEKVLESSAIPELAEMVFILLGPKDILAAAQVNKLFEGIICASTRVQTLLHFRPNVDSFYASMFDFRQGPFGSSSMYCCAQIPRDYQILLNEDVTIIF